MGDAFFTCVADRARINFCHIGNRYNMVYFIMDIVSCPYLCDGQVWNAIF